MASVNRVTIVGNVGGIPEVRYTPKGRPVCVVSVATTDRWKDKQTQEPRERTEWHRIVFWDRLAEVAGEYIEKGREIYVEGKNRTREWEKDGIKRWTTEIHATDLQLLGGKRADTPSAPDAEAPEPEAEE